MEKEKIFVYARLHNPEVQKNITGKVWDTPTGDSLAGYEKSTMIYNDLTTSVASFKIILQYFS